MSLSRKLAFLLTFCYVELIFVRAHESESDCGCSSPNSTETFNLATQETWTLTYNKCSLEVIAGTTKGTATGGGLGNKVFAFLKLYYTWVVSETCQVDFKVFVYYIDKRYKTLDEAAAKGGLLLLGIPVPANESKDNSKFNDMEKIMQQINKPGDSIPVPSFPTFKWFDNRDATSKYKSYTATVVDRSIGKTIPNVIINELDSEPGKDFFSYSQRGFKKLRQSLPSPILIKPQSTPTNEQGMEIYELPI